MTAEIKKRRFAEGVEVTNPTDLALKFEVLAADPSGTEGDVYYNSVTKAPKVYNGSVWGALGGGAGGGVTNLNSNPNAASGVDLSATNDVGDYIDVGSADPKGVVASSVTTGHPLDPVFASGVRLTFADDSAAEEYTRLRFRVPPGSRNTNLAYFHYQLASSYVTQTAMIELYSYSDAYSSDEARVVLSSDDSTPETLIPNYDGQFKFNFDSDDREYYELRYVNNGATAGTLTLNEVTITPSLSVVSGPAKVPPQVYTPGTNGLGTIGGSNVTWSRDGEFMYIDGEITAGTTTAAELQIDLPPNTTIYHESSSAQVVGDLNRNAATTHLIHIVATSGDTYLNASRTKSDGADNQLSPANGSSLINSSERFSFFAKVRIAEWSGGAYYGSNDVEYASVGGTWDAASSTTVYGMGGSLMGGALTAGRTKTITWQTSVQPTDRIEVWASQDQVNWMPINGSRIASGGGTPVIPSLNAAGSVVSGAGVTWGPGSTATETEIYFSRYAAMANDDSPANDWPSSAAYWVVTKSKAGAASGFGHATATQSGLVKDDVVAAKVYAGGAQSIADATTTNVQFTGTVEGDTHGAWSTDTYTVPFDGWYSISSFVHDDSISVEETAAVSMWVEVDGTDSDYFVRDRIGYTAAGGRFSISGTLLKYLTSGQALQIELSIDTNAATFTPSTSSYFAIHRISGAR
jgi:hypothetical protein